MFHWHPILDYYIAHRHNSRLAYTHEFDNPRCNSSYLCDIYTEYVYKWRYSSWSETTKYVFDPIVVVSQCMENLSATVYLEKNVYIL